MSDKDTKRKKVESWEQRGYRKRKEGKKESGRQRTPSSQGTGLRLGRGAEFQWEMERREEEEKMERRTQKTVKVLRDRRLVAASGKLVGSLLMILYILWGYILYWICYAGVILWRHLGCESLGHKCSCMCVCMRGCIFVLVVVFGEG